MVARTSTSVGSEQRLLNVPDAVVIVPVNQVIAIRRFGQTPVDTAPAKFFGIVRNRLRRPPPQGYALSKIMKTRKLVPTVVHV